MTLFEDIKVSLRVVTDKTDSEVQTLIDAALYDMERVGVNPALLQLDGDSDLPNAFVKNAVRCYCKGMYGYDNAESGAFMDSYYRIVNDLLNSSQNIAAIEEEADVEQEPQETGLAPSDGDADGGE